MKLKEELIRTKKIYTGKYVQAEERVVRLPDGKEAVREIVRPPNAVGVIPVESDGTVHLVRQYRTAIDQITLEIPAGVIDAGESQETAARRECEEETGMRPGRMEWLFRYYHSVGFSTGNIEVFLAHDLENGNGDHQEEGEFIERIRMPFDELYQMAVKGDIIDSKTLLAVMWYRHRVLGKW
ncbi:MAG TPA: NUDIX hydrolase [Nitrospiria bacterium]|nr:NUDIX hydrolase [Nitrospiria bacterium]